MDKIRHSCKANEQLISLAGKTVVAPIKVRWRSSKLLMIQRLLDIRGHVATVCDAQRWDGLSQKAWAMLETVNELLKPLAIATDILAREHGAPLPLVFQQILDLQEHLRVFSKDHPEAAEPCELMLQRMQKWTQKY